MNIHKNARLTPRGREILVQRIVVDGLRVEEAAQACGVSVRTAYKWLARYRAEGLEGLQERSSRPQHTPHRTPEPLRQHVARLRRERWTYRHISKELGVAQSTVARILAVAGLNRLSSLEPAKPVIRYVCDEPGELLHLDFKKLARFWRPGQRVTGDPSRHSVGAGWEHVHVAIDDCSRIAFTTIHKNQSGRSACQALVAAVRYYRGYGITIRKVMTDNGGCYKSKHFRKLCQRLGIRHVRTKPYTPQTNGKAERFIQTALREWAYARSYENSEQRAQAMPAWLHQYNWHRPHSALNYEPPISTVSESLNNLLGIHK